MAGVLACVVANLSRVSRPAAAHSAALDLQLRKLWLTLQARARVYDAGLDGTNVQQAPEAGDVAGAETT